MQHKKLLSFLTAAVMLTGTVTPTLAAGDIPVPSAGDKAGQKGENQVPVTLEVLKQNKPIARFSVTVPTALPLVMDLSGNVVTATNARVQNNSSDDVVVTDVKLSSADGWKIVPYADSISEKPSNTKELGMRINGCDSVDGGLKFNQDSFPMIKEATALAVEYSAIVPRQRVAQNVGTVANSVFVIGWADPSVEEPLDNKPHSTDTPLDKVMMAEQLSALTGDITFSREKAPSDATIPLNENGSVVAKVVGQDAVVYSKNGGGVAAPANSSYLFSDKDYEGYKAKSLNLSGMDTSNVTNMTNMLCKTAATSVDLSGIDTSKAVSLIGMFQYSNATTLDLSGFDTSAAKNMNFMFNGSKATIIEGLSGFNTSNVTSMNGMFSSSQVSDLDLSSFDTRKVTSMESMFSQSSVTDLDLSGFNTDRVTNMKLMFYSCPVKTLNISGFNTSNVEKMDSMFYGSKLPTLDLSHFNTSKVKTMNSMFNKSIAKTIDLSSFDMGKVTDTYGMFDQAKATKVYCRTQAELSKMQSSHGCSATGFVVGHP